MKRSLRLETLKRRVGWKGGQTRVRVEKLSVKAPLRPPRAAGYGK